jgi:hypothetical protein
VPNIVANQSVLATRSKICLAILFTYVGTHCHHLPQNLFPVTESEVEKVAKGLKNKLSAGIDEIPDYVVKQ